ncbi:MAG: tetratricopeptide repeat protein [Bacteroidota bacterium]
MAKSRFEALKEFLAQDPNDSFTRYALAMEYVGQHELAKAVEQLEDLLGRDRLYVPAYQQLGYLYADFERRDEAIAILQRGIEVAMSTGDTHARSEMLDALDELELS